ncbi:Gfo/Idh/MocA family protein [Georgenia subflava]|uniref:Gfo/Idh/MocA family oxidoreductase n=1 Tax=Georgenia subflava TaxID=1622177 RepID=A0A6N7EGP6_9MICO|nr:Gfo/Idh/MocA family oxidoreductase [Georgenia subflava]MPV35835.1 gfo/Idh/MocA family oxidoreductase [Georgenia subflava]
MTASPIGIGVVGMGSIGRLHVRALLELGSRAALVAYSGSRTLTDELLLPEWPALQLPAEQVVNHPDVDVVAICSPSASHAELVIAALEAGRHVVVEKPLALTVPDAARIAGLAREKDLIVSMISQRRFEAEHELLKSAVVQGALGEIRLATTHVHWFRDDDYYRAATWRSSMAAGGGSLMNQGVHNVDVLRWLCGPVESVTAQYGTLAHSIDAEDTTVATLRFRSGALGVVTTTTATPPGSPATISLHGSRGAVVLGQGEIHHWDVPGVPPPGPKMLLRDNGASDPLAIGHAGHLAQWREVLTAIENVEPAPIDADDAVETVRLLCAIYQAAETGREVRPADLN